MIDKFELTYTESLNRLITELNKNFGCGQISPNTDWVKLPEVLNQILHDNLMCMVVLNKYTFEKKKLCSRQESSLLTDIRYTQQFNFRKE